MRIVPVVPGGITDQKVLKFLTDVAKALRAIPDIQFYASVAVWKLPFDLYCPLSTSPQPRVEPPVAVRLARATVASDPLTIVAPQDLPTWQWRGHDTVRILDQPGLVEGVRYNLIYEVASG